MSKPRMDVSLSGVTGGYPGYPASNPYLMPQLMEAATNCVTHFCRVQAGEKVLIVAEPDTDPLVVACFNSAATLAGAETAVMTVPPFSIGGSVRGQPGDMLVGAFDRCDVVIACTYFEFAHAERTFFSRIFGSEQRVCSVLMGATAGCLVTSGRFPISLSSHIGELMLQKMEKAKQVRYVTASGTDVTFKGLRNLSYSRPLERGTWGIFPAMGINFYPETSRGTLVFDESSLTGKPLEPVKITVKDNRVTRVEGGSRADAATIEQFANGGYYIRHTVIGTNPKTRMHNAPEFERERAAGTTYLGMDGTGPTGGVDLTAPGFSHVDMIFDTPTVYIDDEMVVDRRRLLVLEDPSLVEAARRFGDPQRVLAQSPLIW